MAAGVQQQRGERVMVRRGFTLLETVLAAVIGGAVLLTALGLFSLMERSESTLDRQFHQTREMGTLQIVLRRSFNAMLMSEISQESLEATDQEAREQLGNGEVLETEDPAWDNDGNRPRVILEYDMSAELLEVSRLVPGIPNDPMGAPQRFEMVFPRAPIPASLRLPTRGWAANGFDVESGPEVYGISGAVRGVFELRPNGAREMLLMNNGMTPSGGERVGRDYEPGWTLWWRPVFPDEIARIQAGLPESSDDMLRAAAEAYPLVRGIKKCRFLAFDNAFRKPVYAARTATDLPAYVEVEIETYSGIYSNWMFEVGWLNGPDPTIIEEEESDDPDAAPAPDGNGNGAGGNNGGNNNGTNTGRLGGGNRDRTTTTRQQRGDRPQGTRQDNRGGGRNDGNPGTGGPSRPGGGG